MKVAKNLSKFSSYQVVFHSIFFFKVLYSSLQQRQLTYASAICFPRKWRLHGIRHLLVAQRRAFFQISKLIATLLLYQVLTEFLQWTFNQKVRLSLLESLSQVSLIIPIIPYVFNEMFKVPDSLLSEEISICPIHDFKSSAHIFTDGFKTKDGTVVDFCVYKFDSHIFSWCARLDPVNSVFQASSLLCRLVGCI